MRLRVLLPLLIFALVAGALYAGLSLRPRDIPSALLGKPAPAFELPPVEGRKWPADLEGTWHHMGTTRMHDSPRLGVVDRNCRVHGMSNLYVAGSSVFPTSGANFPTITLAALAFRLSEHLTTEVRASTERISAEAA